MPKHHPWSSEPHLSGEPDPVHWTRLAINPKLATQGLLLVSPSPRGPKVSDMTEQLNSNIQIWSYTDEFLLTRIIGTLHKTSSTVFASHLLLSMHILLALSTLSLLRKKEVWRRRGTLVALSFPSSHCLQPKCWANTGKELEYQRM